MWSFWAARTRFRLPLALWQRAEHAFVSAQQRARHVRFGTPPPLWPATAHARAGEPVLAADDGSLRLGSHTLLSSGERHAARWALSPDNARLLLVKEREPQHVLVRDVAGRAADELFAFATAVGDAAWLGSREVLLATVDAAGAQQRFVWRAVPGSAGGELVLDAGERCGVALYACVGERFVVLERSVGALVHQYDVVDATSGRSEWPRDWTTVHRGDACVLQHVDNCLLKVPRGSSRVLRCDADALADSAWQPLDALADFDGHWRALLVQKRSDNSSFLVASGEHRAAAAPQISACIVDNGRFHALPEQPAEFAQKFVTYEPWPLSPPAVDKINDNFYYTGVDTFGTHSIIRVNEQGHELLHQAYDEPDFVHGVERPRIVREPVSERASLLLIGGDRSGNAVAQRKPVMLSVYGAYGNNIPEVLSMATHELVCDEGWALGTANVSVGTGAKGKMAAADDLLDCVEALWKRGHSHVFVSARSAGAIPLARAVMLEPQLFSGVCFKKPFLALTDSMLPEEVAEWGSPDEVAQYDPLRTAESLLHNDRDKLDIFPPTLAICGGKDTVCAPTHAIKFLQQLRRVGVPRERVMMKIYRKDAHKDSAKVGFLQTQFFEWCVRNEDAARARNE